MSYPVLAANSSWFCPADTSIKRSNITKVSFMDTFGPNGSEVSWDASEAKDGSIMCYLRGTEMFIVGNGSGKILANPDSSYLFADINQVDWFSSLSSIENLELLDTSNATTMFIMFAMMTSLTSLDLSSLKTGNVTDFQSMFNSCSALTSITGMSQWDMSKGVRFKMMFRGCKSLLSLDVSDWDTSSCTDMSYMFYDCRSLKSLDLSAWNVSKVTTMMRMFASSQDKDKPSYGYQGNGAIESLNLANWDVSSCTDMYGMFSGQKKLKNINLETWKGTSSCTDMGWMFWTCSSLKSIDFSKFDTRNVVSMHHLFAHDSALTEIKGIENLDLRSCISVNAMLHSTSIKSVDISKWNTSKVQDFSQFVESNTKLEEIIGLEKIDTSNVRACGQMFLGCQQLKMLNLSTFNTKGVTSSWIDPYRNDEGNGMAWFFPSNHVYDQTTGARYRSRLEKVILGPNFSFNGDGSILAPAVLPDPDPELTPGTRGVWYNIETLEQYQAINIPNNNNVVATYSCVPVSVMVKNTTLQDFAEVTRQFTGTTDKLSPSGAVSTLREAVENNDTYNLGVQAGRQEEHEWFWNIYQQNGNRTDYQNAFGGYGWTEKTFKPVHSMNVTNGYMMFRYNSAEVDLVEWFKDLGVSFDDSNNATPSYMYFYSKFTRIGTVTLTKTKSTGDIFAYCKNLVTIDKVITHKDLSYTSSTFSNCEALENITFEGIIASNIDFKWSTKLSKDSIISIINALSTTASGLSVTLHKTAVDKAFESSEGANDGESTAGWGDLVSSRLNWEIKLVEE